MDRAPAKILIFAAQPASARRWSEMLQGSGMEVWVGEAAPDDARPEVVVTDSLALSAEQVGFGEAAVLRIGGVGPADVWLPADASVRELRLACGLLAQVVRLRQKERSAAQLRRRLSEEAMTDPLTGLPNRRAWDQILAERLTVRDDSRRLCLAIFDLDHFKRVNDDRGHAAGDAVLRAVGRTLGESLRQEDFVARLGGDEFGLLLWAIDEVTALTVVDRVRAALPSRIAQASVPTVTASAGVQLAPASPGDAPLPCPDDLYAAADAALREAKQQGRDRTVAARR